MVEATPAQQLELQSFVVTTEIADYKEDNGIEQTKKKLDFSEATEVLR